MWATLTYTSCKSEIPRKDGQREIDNESGNMLYDAILISTGYKPKEEDAM